MNVALKHEMKYESKSWNYPEKTTNYLKCVQSLPIVQKIEKEDYLAILKTCLYLEQFEVDQEMKRHSLKNHKLKKSNLGHCFVIDVPSLTSEHSVIVPDDRVSLYHVVLKRKIMAKVVSVQKNEVTVRLLDTKM